MENTNNSTIKVSSLKELAPVYSNQVKHFCKLSARLYGKLALREQLTIEGPKTIQQVEEDCMELQKEIVQLANNCRVSIRRLNQMAVSMDIPRPLFGVDDMGLSDFIAAINEYVSRLVAESDFRSWELENQSANS